MKRILLIVLVFCVLLVSPLVASSFDYSLFWGPAIMDFTYPGVSMSYGMNFGLTKSLELSLWGTSTLTPKFFGDNRVGLELDYALLGVRTTSTAVVGSGINMLVGGGIMASTNNSYNLFIPTDVFLSLSTLTVGNPILERRERLAKLVVSYNWFQNKVGVIFNIALFDYYLTGTWRDYR